MEINIVIRELFVMAVKERFMVFDSNVRNAQIMIFVQIVNKKDSIVNIGWLDYLKTIM